MMSILRVRRFRRCVSPVLVSVSLAWLLLAAVAPSAFAQTESGGASVEGSVLDPTGAAVRGARVVLKNLETGVVRNATSDASGRFVLQAVAVGPYRVEAQADGFAAGAVDDLRLAVGDAARIRVQLNLPGVTEQVAVSADESLATVATSSGSVLGLAAIQNIPIRGRNFTEFVQLTPAVEQEGDRFGLVIAGQRSINSNVALDGADFNDPVQGNQRGGNESVFFFPQTAVREFQVVRSGAGAEVGRTGAGFVNVVTKSGTNTTSGEAFYFNRNRALTSADAFGRKLNNQQNQFGGSMGGPLRRDRAFYFAAVEQNFLRVPFVVKFQDQPAGVVLPAELQAQQGEQRGTNNPTAVFARTDVQLSSVHTLNLQYTYGRLRGTNFNFDSPQQDAAATTNYTRTTDSHAVKVSLLSMLGSSFLNELRAQVATDWRDEAPNASIANITITGVGTLGGDSGRPRLFDSTRYQVTDNVSLYAGSHQWRVGFDANLVDVRQERESNIQGRYDFTSLANYLAGKISRYRQTLSTLTPDALTFTGQQKELAIFAQDKIAVGQAVTVTAGLRWEGQWNPQPTHPNPAIAYTATIPNDLTMWQPRLGLAWTPDRAGRTVVRANAGLYFARTPANLFQRVFTDNGITTVAVDSKTDPLVLSYLTFPSPLTAAPAGLKISAPQVFGFDPAFRNPRNAQVSLAVEHQFAHGWSATLGYIHSNTDYLQRRLDRNLFAPTYDATGMPIFPKTRPDPTIGILSVNESTAKARYDGFQVGMTGRVTAVELQMHYTLAWNKDDDSNERNFSKEGALDVFNLGPEYTWSKQDVRHHLTVSAVTHLPGGVMFSGVVMARTGFPYTAVTGSDTQNDGNDFNDRAIINGTVSARNAFRQPSFFNLDLRLAKSFGLGPHRQIEFTIDVMNVTQAKNLNFGADAVSTFGTPAAPVASAGQATYAPSTARFGGPRQVQIGARFHF